MKRIQIGLGILAIATGVTTSAFTSHSSPPKNDRVPPHAWFVLPKGATNEISAYETGALYSSLSALNTATGCSEEYTGYICGCELEYTGVSAPYNPELYYATGTTTPPSISTTYYSFYQP